MHGKFIETDSRGAPGKGSGSVLVMIFLDAYTVALELLTMESQGRKPNCAGTRRNPMDNW
jgi:hypothetical protein